MKTQQPQKVQRPEFRPMNSFPFLKTKETNKKKKTLDQIFPPKNQGSKDTVKTTARKDFVSSPIRAC